MVLGQIQLQLSHIIPKVIFFRIRELDFCPIPYETNKTNQALLLTMLKNAASYILKEDMDRPQILVVSISESKSNTSTLLF